LNSKRYARFLAEFHRFCKTPGAGVKQAALDAGALPSLSQARHVLPSRILDRFEAVRRYEILFESDEPIPIDTLHALRIDCKYLRYILEFSLDLIGDDGQQLIQQIKQLQDQLGDLNDAAVAQEMLQALPSELQDATVAAYIATQETTIAELRQTIPAAFCSFIAAENRHLLAAAIARI
jgi:CHAD domain-containing protein